MSNVKVINSKRAYALYCMRQLCLSKSLPDYVKSFKSFKKYRLSQGKSLDANQYAIVYFETYEQPFRLSVDWNLKDNYYAFD